MRGSWLTIINERVKTLTIRRTDFMLIATFARHAKFTVYFYLLIQVCTTAFTLAIAKALSWPQIAAKLHGHRRKLGKVCGLLGKNMCLIKDRSLAKAWLFIYSNLLSQATHQLAI